MTFHPFFASVGLLLSLVILAGCPQPKELPPVTLQPLSVVVLDDPSLAEAIKRELGARLDREAQVQSLASAELMTQSSLRHDVVIYPPSLMGEFIARGWIDPLPPAARDDEDLDLAGVFTAIRQQEIRWGNEVYAVPFGSPVPVLIVREDLLEQLELEIPETWQAYAACVEAIQESGLLTQEGTTLKSATLEPTADDWLPALLYARAASYVKHTDNLSLSLDLTNGKSLLGTGGFVRAAEQLQAMIETMPATHRGLSPGEVAGAALKGESVLAIGWIDATSGDSQSNLPLKFAPLPGSTEIYDVVNDRWEPAGSGTHSVPLISAAGMVGSVSSLSGQTVDAAEILTMLAGRELAPLISTRGTHTTLYRNESVPATEAWVGDQLPRSLAIEYGQVVQAELQGARVVAPLRIPGQAEYHTALAGGLRKLLDDQFEPLATLAEVAKAWDEITAVRGLESQRAAYLASMGISNR